MDLPEKVKNIHSKDKPITSVFRGRMFGGDRARQTPPANRPCSNRTDTFTSCRHLGHESISNLKVRPWRQPPRQLFSARVAPVRHLPKLIQNLRFNRT